MENRPDYRIENTCVNCGNLFYGKFCNTCGQKNIKRFTGIYLWQSLRENILGIDSGLLHTFKELWTSPGKMILNYLKGATSQYYSPLKYLALWTAVYLILIALINKTEQNPQLFWDFMATSYRHFSREVFDDFYLFMKWFMEQNTNLYILGIIPFISVSGYLFFRNHKFNLTEIIIFYTYFYGQFVFCVVVANLVNLIPQWDGTRLSTLIIFISYFFLFFRMQLQFFDEGWKISLLKGVGILSCGTVMYWSFVFLAIQGLKYFMFIKLI